LNTSLDYACKYTKHIQEYDDDDDPRDDDDQEDERNDEDDEEKGSNDEQASDEEEFIHPSLSTHAEEETRDEESFDPIPKTAEHTDDEGNGDENLGTNVGRVEGKDEEDEAYELYRDVNINLGRGIQLGDVHTTQKVEDSHVTLTSVNLDGQQQSSSVSSQFVTMAPLPVSAPTITPLTIATITTIQQTPTLLTTTPSTLLQDLPNLGSLFGFDNRLKTLERMNEAVKVAVQIQSDRLRDEAQAENDVFLKTIDENMQKIIKEQVKEQVKVQVSKILPKIEQTVNEQLKAEVLTRSSNSSKTSYARNLYKALVKAYKSDKIILDTYGDTVTLKRRRDDDADKDEEPSAGPDRGSKRRREGKEPESASALQEKDTKSAGKSTQGSNHRQTSTSESPTAEEPMQTTFEMEEPSHPEFKTSAGDQPILVPSQHLEPSTRCRKLPEEPQPNKPDKYRSDLKRKEAYIAYSNPRGFIYQNKDKQNRLMQIDELHKFKDGTLTDVRTALDDRLKGIRMKYMPRSIWRKSDKDRMAAMIQAIDKRLKTRRIMRSLEKFVGGRLYEGDFRMLQRTI
nr:hypothetical protein [Tanacetum cinerariifolium]